jgi:hypothetical protein
MSIYWFRQPSQDPCTTGLFCSMLICPQLINYSLAKWKQYKSRILSRKELFFSFCESTTAAEPGEFTRAQPNLAGWQYLWVSLWSLLLVVQRGEKPKSAIYTPWNKFFTLYMHVKVRIKKLRCVSRCKVRCDSAWLQSQHTKGRGKRMESLKPAWAA